MRCGNIVIGKIPEIVPEWMQDDEGIINNGFWSYDRQSLPDILAKVIASWMQDEIPQELIKSVDETNKKYTQETWNVNVLNTINTYIEERINEFKVIKSQTINNNNSETEA